MWQRLALMVLVGQIVSGASAQSHDLAGEIEELRSAVELAVRDGNRLDREHSRLLDSRRRGFAELETMLAALADDEHRTAVRSEADPIRIFGDFRVRYGYVRDRDFGNQDNGLAPPLQALLGVGGGSEEDDEGTWLTARFLLGLDYQFSRRVMTRLSIQALGNFDNDDTPAQDRGGAGAGFSPGGSGSTEGVGLVGPDLILTDIRLYEAFIQFEDILDIEGLDLRTGRQEIALGNEFVFGDNDFFGGETFDALRLSLDLGELRLDAIAAKLAVTESIRPSTHPYPDAGRDDGFDDDELYSVYLRWRPEPEFEADLYWVFWNGNGGGSTGSLGNAIPSLSTGDDLTERGFLRGFFHTLGLRLAGAFGDLDYNLEFAWQTGSLDDFLDRDVDGIALEIDLGFTLDVETSARLYVRGLYSEGAHGDESGFIPLFPERHSYHDPDRPRSGARYGLMDIIPMDNVFSLQAGFAFEPASDWRIGAAVLWATHDADLRPFAAEEDDIGWEFDIWASYRYSEETTLGFGFGIFLPDEGAPFHGGSFVGPNGRDQATLLGYLDLRVLF